MKSVCVFCGSSSGSSPAFATAAVELAAQLAARRITLVYGGAGVGLMGTLADAMLAAGGQVIGVIPESLVTVESAHRGLTELHATKTMHERKQRMYDLSDAFIALPGGLGTLEELLETLTWAQLGLHAKPCGVLNVDGYYDPLLAQLDRGVATRLIRPEQRAMLRVDTDPATLLAYLGA